MPFIANLWTKGNKYNFISDILYIKYHSDVYGLCGRIDPNQGYTIDFSVFKFHQTVTKEVIKNLYVGLGYYYDQFWNITALDSLKRNVSNRLKHAL